MKLNIKHTVARVSAAVSTLLLTGTAHAQGTDVMGLSKTVGSNIYAVTNIISTGSYLVGAGFGMAGVMSLKKHAENPAQEPVGKGVGRIAAGAALAALPAVINTAFNSMGINETQGVGVTGSTDRF